MSPGRTNTKGLHFGSAASGPWMHAWSVRAEPEFTMFAPENMLLTNRPWPLIWKQVCVLPLDDPKVQPPADAKAAPAPTKSAVAERDAAKRSTFNRRMRMGNLLLSVLEVDGFGRPGGEADRDTFPYGR